MTDVFLSYAREDRERVRKVCEGLQAEGWDVWWDPSEPLPDQGEALDGKLGSAGAVLVVWSAQARFAEYVRSEAATGLYRNKLVQVSIDSVTPPRPFDQVEATDLQSWSGSREDPNWQKIVQAVRLYAGAPGSARPQVTKTAAKKDPKKASGNRPAYLERRTINPGPVIGLLMIALVGGGVWYFDPLHMFKHREATAAVAAATATPTSAAVEAAEKIDVPAPAVVETSPEAEQAWAKVNRNKPADLRAYLAEHPVGAGADSARSILRVLDAQAWVDAVDVDREAAYATYLKNFPADAVIPGAKAAAAAERIKTLGVERAQAIEQIQRGLTNIGLYRGKVDGQPGDGTWAAAKVFAQSKKRATPELKTGAPRELRAFGDLIAAEAVARKSGKATAAPPVEKVVTAAAEAADLQRQQQAEQARAIARAGAEDLALGELRRSEESAWGRATVAGTPVAYQAFLPDYPASGRAVDARATLAKISEPFSLDRIAPGLRNTVSAARQAQSGANARATSARDRAARADVAAAAARDGAEGTSTLTAADGDRYEGEVRDGAINGLGVRISGEAVSAGDRYRGELRDGLSAGLGVYEFASNPNNASAGALRYEGEHANDRASGLGVTYWKSGDRFAGGANHGVMSFGNGQRYEGEMKNGVRDGLGVVWSADGEVSMAGRWVNGELVEPMVATSAGPSSQVAQLQ